MLNKINKVFFLIYISTLLFIPDYGVVVVFKGKHPPISEIILLGMVILFAAELLVSKAKRDELLKLIKNKVFIYINILFLLIILLMVISVSYAPEYKLWMQETIRFISIYFIAVFCMVQYGKNNTSEKVLKFMVIGSGVVGILGIYQYFTGNLIDIAFKSGYTFGAKVRVTSIYLNPNTFAAFIIILIFPLLMLAVYEKNHSRKIIYSAILVLLLVNLLMTFSRSAWLGLILGLVILAIVWNKKLLWVLAGLVGIAATASPIRSRFLDLFDKSVNSDRIRIWKTYLHIIKDNILLGVGNGNGVNKYDYYIAKYPELNYNGYTRYPSHNSYIKVFSELGIFGIISFIALIIIILVMLYKYYTKVNDSFMKAFYLGVFTSMCSICFMNLYDNLFFVPKMIMILWIFVFIGIGNYIRLNKA